MTQRQPALSFGVRVKKYLDDRICSISTTTSGQVEYRILRPAFTLSRAGAAALSIQGGFDAANQDGPGKGLGQETNSFRLQPSSADDFIRATRDAKKRRVAAPGAHMRQQVQTAHNRHLRIRNHT